jgi:hypothetical protein
MRKQSRVSLRGTLAQELARRMVESLDPQQAAEDFLRDVLHAGEVEVLHYVDGGTLVIGRKSEQGQFPPDW